MEAGDHKGKAFTKVTASIAYRIGKAVTRGMKLRHRYKSLWLYSNTQPVFIVPLMILSELCAMHEYTHTNNLKCRSIVVWE